MRSSTCVREKVGLSVGAYKQRNTTLRHYDVIKIFY